MKDFSPFIFGLLAICTWLAGCGDESGPKTFTLRQGSHMLTSHPWRLTGRSINGKVVLQECRVDDTLFFAVISGNDEEGNPNKDEFFLMPGSMPCEGAVPEDADTLDQGTWELRLANSSTGLAVTLYRQDDTLNASIDRISGKFLTLSYLREEQAVREDFISGREE